MIEDVSCVDVVLHDDLAAAVGEELLPSLTDRQALLWRFEGGARSEDARAHVYVVHREDSKDDEDGHGIATREDNVAFSKSELPDLDIRRQH